MNIEKANPNLIKTLQDIPVESQKETDIKEEKEEETIKSKTEYQEEILQNLFIGKDNVPQIERVNKIIEKYKNIFKEDVPEYITKHLNTKTADIFLDILDANWFLPAATLLKNSDLLYNQWIYDAVIANRIKKLEKIIGDFNSNTYTGPLDIYEIHDIKTLIKNYYERISQNDTLKEINITNIKKAA
ncbi:MAG: hypothetical protein WC025_01620 [Candidatus Magasanikbacteria bacterium]